MMDSGVESHETSLFIGFSTFLPDDSTGTPALLGALVVLVMLTK